MSNLPAHVGILLTNLGTPDQPTVSAVRRYLAQFLWDPRVIEFPRALWWLILHGYVLRVRPQSTTAAYRTVWTDEGSPLLVGLKRQAHALSQACPGGAHGLEFAIGMRYGNPSIASGLEQLRATGVDRILIVPLYPQYSATTTASTFDEVAAVLRSWRRLPALRFLNHYHDDWRYIKALAASIRNAGGQRHQAARLLFSFHGIPQRYVDAGDPYYQQCQTTAKLTAAELELDDQKWAVAFQSRVGREEWLRPYTDEILEGWATQGLESVVLVCPGFSADCLETLEEVDVRYRQLFLGAGGKAFTYVPALNDDELHIQALSALIQRNLQGWIT